MANMKDSGQRREFETGAVRDSSTGKGRYDLISPLALHRLALWTEAGALKYDERNWEEGIPLCSGYIDSLERHIARLLCGLEDEDHAAAIMWNAQGIVHTLEAIRYGLLPEDLDDRPLYFIDDQDAGREFFSPKDHDLS